ncbi:MAG: flagellar basal body rod protein FlgF [Pseudomonadales bacterium]|nr:flagellar basal body rod protein FlgF [Pseudomonadales bacterium]
MYELLESITESAKKTLQAQQVNANNLANASTVGFKAEIAYYMEEEGSLTLESMPDLTPGIVQQTGRALDVSIQGDGWLAIMAEDGTEAYTRRGDLRVDALGQLTTGLGHPVLGNNGPIALPPFSQVEIGADGTLSIVPFGQQPNTLAVVDRLKLVTLQADQLQRREDGHLQLPDGEVAAPDAAVRVMSGAIEGSNVNVVGELVRMIDLARRFESEIQLMQDAKENSSALASVMNIN